MAAKLTIIRHVPFRFETGTVGSIVELINGTATKQVDDHRCRGRVDVGRPKRVGRFNYLGFAMPTFERLPFRQGGERPVVKSKTFFRKDETIRICIGEREPIIVPAFFSQHTDFGFHTRSPSVASK